MQSPSDPQDEQLRLEALRRYDILDTSPEAEYDDITMLASTICEVPIALITFLDTGRQWSKSKFGIEAEQTNRKLSFCAHAILDSVLFEVEDASKDVRFHDNPLITGEPNIRFYAGAPLITSDGFRLGALSVIDRVPRTLSESQRNALEALSRQVVRLLESRAMARDLATQSRFQRAVLNSRELSLVSTTVDGIITGFNDGAEELLGYRAEEMVGQHDLSICYESGELARRAADMSKTLGQIVSPGFTLLTKSDRGEKVGSGDWNFRRKDGSLVSVHSSLTPIFDESETIIGFLSTARDIGDRKKAEASHQRALEFIHKISERVPGMIYQFRMRPDGTASFPYASQGMQEIFRLSPEIVVDDASPGLKVIHPDDRASVLASIRQSAEDLSPWRKEYRILFADKTVRWLFSNALPEREEDGSTLWHGFITDVTEQKAAALALQRSQQFMQTLIDNLPVGIYTKCVQSANHAHGGEMIVWNRAAERMSGLSSADVIGRPDRAIFPATMAEASEEQDRMMAESKQPTVIPALPFQHRDGSTRLLRVTSVPLLDADGEIEYTLGIAEDITELVLQQDELRQRKAELEVVNDASPLGLYHTDTSGSCTYVNRSYEAMTGLSNDAALGLGWLNALHPDDVERVKADWFNSTKNNTPYDSLHRFVHPDGTEVIVRAQAAPVIVNDMVKGYVGTTTDVTARQAAEKKLADSERQLLSIMENIPALVTRVDRNERILFVNSQVVRLFGMDDALMLGRSMKDEVAPGLYKFLKPQIAKVLAGNTVSFESFAQTPKGMQFYHSTYVPDADDEGNVHGFFSMTFDITDRRNGELRQAANEKRLHMITDNLPAAISYVDDEQRFRFINATMCDWIRMDPKTVIGQTMRDIFGEALYEERRQYIDRAFQGTRTDFFEDPHLFHQHQYLQITYIPDVDIDGRVKGIYTLSNDITALKKTEDELRRLARHDSLTGLPNRVHLYDTLEEALARGRRLKTGVAVLFLDIDHFKTINDSLGHGKGDLVLQEFAGVLTSSVRSTDTVARLAGDEFIIILEGLKQPNEAELVATKIIERLRKPWVLNGDKLVITTSIGIAFDRKATHSGLELIGYADESLYEAKGAGRNTFRMRVFGAAE